MGYTDDNGLLLDEFYVNPDDVDEMSVEDEVDDDYDGEEGSVFSDGEGEDEWDEDDWEDAS